MNKNINSKYTQIIIAVIMSFIMLLTAIMPENQAQAKAKLEKTYFFSVYSKMPSSADDRSRILFMQYPWKKPVTAAESSDEDVFTVQEKQTIGDRNIYIKLAKVKEEASAKPTFTVGGKEYTTNIVVKPYANPCKTFKIGNKDFKGKFDKASRYHLTKQKKNISGKVVIKAKKGWEVKEIVLNEGFSSGKRVKIKNGTSVILNPTAYENFGGAFWVVFKNKKTKEEMMMELFYNSLNEKKRNEVVEFYGSGA